MIRKAVIVVLTLGAVGTLAIFTLSFAWSYAYSGGSNTTIDVRFGDVIVIVHSARRNTRLGWFVRRIKLAPEWAYPWPDTRQLTMFPKYVRGMGMTAAVKLPLWMFFVLFAAYPAITFIRGPLRRWRRRKRGECANCGYNLTGNVTGVCSECGTKIESR